MGIGGVENKVKMGNTKDLISNLKNGFSNNELKIIVQLLQRLKSIKEGNKDISGILKSMKLAMFKD